MSTQQITVVGFVLDTSKLTLYVRQPDQSIGTIDIQMGDPRLRPLVKQLQGPISRKEEVTVDLAQEMFKSEYTQLEENSKGVIRFLKIAKKKLMSLFKKPEDKEEDHIPDHLTAGLINTGISSKLDEIIAHAQPLDSNRRVEPQTIREQAPVTQEEVDNHNTLIAGASPDETIIAITADNKVLAGVEVLASQIKHAIDSGNQTGIENFMCRAALVADKRGHSVKDLLRFVQRGDLPIADDGSLIAYKVLNRSSKNGYFVDVHSGKVFQKVGSRVQMDPRMVDMDRRHECSNGLHIARRAYLRGFGGNVCTLVKVAPEDVIAVPNYDANKMRVCAYHIIDELSAESYALLNRNLSFTNTDATKLQLAKAIAGQHVGVTEISEIHGPRGGDLVMTEVTGETVVKTQAGIQLFTTSKLQGVSALSDETVLEGRKKDEAVSQDAIADLAMSTSEAKTGAMPEQKVDPNLFQETKAPAGDAVDALLGADEAENDPLIRYEVTQAMPDPNPAPVKAPETPKEKKAVKPAKENKVTAPVKFKTLKEEGQHLEKLFKSFKRGTKESNMAAKDIADFKKRTKKGWDVLGISDAVANSVKIITK